MSLSRDQKCELLRKELTFKNFFATMCAEPDATAAVWLEGNRERSYNFEEFKNWAEENIKFFLLRFIPFPLIKFRFNTQKFIKIINIYCITKT